MKKIPIILIIFLYVTNGNAQHFLETFDKKYLDTWGTSQLIDEFGDVSNTTVLTFITNGEYKDKQNQTIKIPVVVLVNNEENYISFDLYDEQYKIFKKINFNGATLLKDMSSGEISKYYFSQKKWCSLLAPITNDENRAIPVKLILDGNGQDLKFKIKKLSWGTSTIIGEYNFTIKAWNNEQRKLFKK
ncbi:hypothetical protein LX95_02879 [Mesonia algae]|uniref:Uncharacterized protein n=1 Tax=Mesonia algae TaxID=213248 RepID=A0A2W7HTP6_9FLAO|nr:hypothetical protein [Mesonia algae]PZW37597.1 hypothetical protein LX95_02879 [Mesonia algae]